MKSINLLLYTKALDVLDERQAETWSKIQTDHEELKYRKWESANLSALVKRLFSFNDYEAADGFFTSYTIPSISKEFDLLRFGKNSLVNIELKTKAEPERIAHQLKQNRLYLVHIHPMIYSFSYIMEEDSFYQLKKGNLIQCEPEDLLNVLKEQIVLPDFNIENAFKPEHYLISPIQNPRRFLTGRYFLTSHQEMFIKMLKESRQGRYCLQGSCGTGKSLVLYHIAFNACKSHPALLIHTGKLSEGHYALKKAGLPIVSVKKGLQKLKKEQFSLVLVDEFSHFPASRLEELFLLCEKVPMFIVSMDPWLMEKRKVLKQKLGKEKEFITFALTNRIRTQPEISRFLSALFSGHSIHYPISSKDIHLIYQPDFASAEQMADWLKLNGYTFINYIPDTVHHPKWASFIPGSMHIGKTIGNEFDKVAAFVDSSFYYEKNELKCRTFHQAADPLEMLYDILGLCRLEMVFIVIGNPKLFADLCQLYEKEDRN